MKVSRTLTIFILGFVLLFTGRSKIFVNSYHEINLFQNLSYSIAKTPAESYGKSIRRAGNNVAIILNQINFFNSNDVSRIRNSFISIFDVYCTRFMNSNEANSNKKLGDLK